MSLSPRRPEIITIDDSSENDNADASSCLKRNNGRRHDNPKPRTSSSRSHGSKPVLPRRQGQRRGESHPEEEPKGASAAVSQDDRRHQPPLTKTIAKSETETTATQATTQENDSDTVVVHPLDQGIDLGMIQPVPRDEWKNTTGIKVVTNRQRRNSNNKRRKVVIWNDSDDDDAINDGDNDNSPSWWTPPRPRHQLKLERPTYPHTKVGLGYQATTLPPAFLYEKETRRPETSTTLGGDVLWDPIAARQCTTMNIDEFLQQSDELRIKVLLLQAVHETGYSTAERAHRRFVDLYHQERDKQDDDVSLSASLSDAQEEQLNDSFSTLLVRPHDRQAQERQNDLTNATQMVQLSIESDKNNVDKLSMRPNYCFQRLAKEAKASLDATMVHYYNTKQEKHEERRREASIKRARTAARRFQDANEDKVETKKATEGSKCENKCCIVCEDGGLLVSCHQCDKSYHLRCHDPPLSEVPKGNNWNCAECKLAKQRPNGSSLASAASPSILQPATKKLKLPSPAQDKVGSRTSTLPSAPHDHHNSKKRKNPPAHKANVDIGPSGAADCVCPPTVTHIAFPTSPTATRPRLQFDAAQENLLLV